MRDFKNYSIPLNFDSFVTENYSSMVNSLRYKVGNDMDRVRNIINTFVLAMLEKDRVGVQRYKRYDSNRFQKIPYKKWFLSLLRYYGFKEYYQRIREKNFIINIDYLDSVVDFKLNKRNYSLEDQKYINLLEDFSQGDIEYYVFIEEISEYLLKFSTKFKNKRGYERNAHSLFSYKLLGFSNKDIAEILKVSQANITIWSYKLKDLIKDYILSGSCKIDI